MRQAVKVYLRFPDGCREYLWATRISENSAKIANIPFLGADVTLGDLVWVAKNGRVLRVLERCGRTRFGEYEPGETLEETRDRWLLLAGHLRLHDIPAEPAVPGHFSMATPLDMDEERLASVAATSPVPFEVCDVVEP
jgi:hypothetical protein